jgi:1-acyl-sn-glycerol-3-phosphate acyltransferase
MQLFSYLLTPIFYLFFGLNLVFFHVVQIITLNIFGHNAHDKSVSYLNYSLMWTMRILGTRIKFNGFTKIAHDKPVLIIMNHQSMWDIPPVVWKLRHKHPKYIAKESLAKYIPSISYNLKHGGSIVINRKKPEESIKKIKAFAQFINEKKYSLCIYPEGTRSRDGKVQPFKTLGVKSILKEIPDLLIVPIAIKNTGKIDNGGKFAKRLGVKTTFTMLSPRTIQLDKLAEDLEKIRQEIIEIVEN